MSDCYITKFYIPECHIIECVNDYVDCGGDTSVFSVFVCLYDVCTDVVSATLITFLYLLNASLEI